MYLRIDLHVHTFYSADSSITPQQLVFYAKKAGLDGVAVTDHNRLSGAPTTAQETDFFIIPGMEIESSQGHVVALNLQEPVQKGLSVDETVDRIHEANGIAVACHPFGLWKGGLGKHVTAKFDAVEVINASSLPFRHSARRSESLALSIGKPRVAGSDAHYGPEIGCAYTQIEAELDVDDVIKAISNGLCQPFGRAIPFDLRLRKILAQFRKQGSLGKV